MLLYGLDPNDLAKGALRRRKLRNISRSSSSSSSSNSGGGGGGGGGGVVDAAALADCDAGGVEEDGAYEGDDHFDYFDDQFTYNDGGLELKIKVTLKTEAEERQDGLLKTEAEERLGKYLRRYKQQQHQT